MDRTSHAKCSFSNEELEDKDTLLNEDLIMSYIPLPPMSDFMPHLKMEFDTTGLQPEVVSNHSLKKMPILDDLEDKHSLSSDNHLDQDVENGILSQEPQSSGAALLPDSKMEFDAALYHPETSSQQSSTIRHIADGFEELKPLSNKTGEFQDNDGLLSRRPPRYQQIETNIDSLGASGVEQREAPSELFGTDAPNISVLKSGIISKNSRKKIEGKVTFRKAQMRGNLLRSDNSPESSLYDHQQPSSSDQHFTGSYIECAKESIFKAHSTPADQGEPVLRRRKNKTVYYEGSDSSENDISDEELDGYDGKPSKSQTCPDNKICSIRKGGKCNKEKENTQKKIAIVQSSKNTYVCRICNESFAFRLLLLNHLKAHDRVENQQCQFYSSKFKNVCLLDRHVTTPHGTNHSFECDICKKTYSHRRALSKHKRRHVDSKQYLCYICGLSLSSPESLGRHVQTHTGERSLLCDKCGLRFLLRESFNYHMNMHLRKEGNQTPEKLFECEICNKKLETRRGYTAHIRKHIQQRIHECTFCQRQFYTKTSLTNHRRTHTGEKPFECKTCGNTFAQFASLYSHSKSHSNERPHNCKFCNKAFNTKRSLNTHLNSHTGARPYKCGKCDKCFGSDNALKVHIKMHKGKRIREKKYSCNICSEMFAVSAYRDLHVALHANPNPFSCEFCSKSFNYKKNMVAHVQRVHPDRNPFKCKLCGKTYDSIRKICVHISSRACEKSEKSPKNVNNQSKSKDVDGNMNVEKRVNLFVCNICDDEFLSVEDISAHFDSSHKK